MIRMVCFDLGGIIVRHHRSWADACAAAGVPLRTGADGPEMVLKRRQLSRLHGSGGIACDDFFDRMAAAMGHLYTPDEVRAVHHAWLIDEYANVGGVIDDLHAAGLDTAILSNTNPGHWARQFPTANGPAEFPTPQKIRRPYASHLLGAVKPDEAIYRAFERATGVAGPAILFFDDLAENVRAAREVGWLAEEIDHTRETEPQLRAALRARGVL